MLHIYPTSVEETLEVNCVLTDISEDGTSQTSAVCVMTPDRLCSALLPRSCTWYLFSSCTVEMKMFWEQPFKVRRHFFCLIHIFLATGSESLILFFQIAKNEAECFQCGSTRYLGPDRTGWLYFCLQSFLSLLRGNQINRRYIFIYCPTQVPEGKEKHWRSSSLLFWCFKVNISGARFNNEPMASTMWPRGHSWTWEYYKHQQDKKNLQLRFNKAVNPGESMFWIWKDKNPPMK